MPAKLISIPFFILAIVFGYLTLEKDENFAPYIIVFVVLLVMTYTFSPQINWWWYKRNPPDIRRPLRDLLIKNLPFYNNLSVAEKKRFRNRMALYMIAVEFIPKGWESLPEDLKAIVAANAVRMTFYQEDFLLPKFERIVIYTTPFPSPQYPKNLHASEVFSEDGVLLFSAQQMTAAFLQPLQYYNLVMHEYIKVFQLSYPNKNYPLLKEINWDLVFEISGFTKNKIEKFIGLPDIDLIAVSGTLYFTHPKAYKVIAPTVFSKWETIFGLHP